MYGLPSVGAVSYQPSAVSIGPRLGAPERPSVINGRGLAAVAHSVELPTHATAGRKLKADT
jgi:hypothetical protein